MSLYFLASVAWLGFWWSWDPVYKLIFSKNIIYEFFKEL